MTGKIWSLAFLGLIFNLLNVVQVESTCPVPDIYEYKFTQQKCIGDTKFESTVSAAGDLIKAPNGVAETCSSGIKTIGSERYLYENGVDGVRIDSSSGAELDKALISSKTIGDSEIKSKIGNGPFTLEFIVKPHFDYATFSSPVKFVLLDMSDDGDISYSCIAKQFSFLLYIAVGANGIVTFTSTMEYGSNSCANIEVSLDAGEPFRFVQDKLYHISIQFSEGLSDGSPVVAMTVIVNPFQGEPSNKTGRLFSSLNPASWSNSNKLRIGSSSYIDASAAAIPWDGDILLAAAYTGQRDLSCRATEEYFKQTLFPTGKLPVAGSVKFSTDEDIPLEGSVGDFGFDFENDRFDITFSGVTAGVLEVDGTPVVNNQKYASRQSYKFIPTENFNGDASFQVLASTQNQKLIEGTRKVTIEVEPVNDPPVFIPPEVPPTVRPGEKVAITIKASDVESIQGAKVALSLKAKFDDVPNTLVGQLELCNGGAISTDLELDTEGEVTVCYVPNETTKELTFDEDVIHVDEMTIVIKDAADNSLVTNASIDISVVNALQGCGRTTETTGCGGDAARASTRYNEDPSTVTAFKLYGSDTASRNLDFKILELPKNGKLFSDAELTTELTENSIIGGPTSTGSGETAGSSVDIYYQPNKDYYNIRVDKNDENTFYETDLKGNSIQSCDQETQDLFNGFCPDILRFSVVERTQGTGNAKSPPVQFPIYVANVRDIYPEPTESLFVKEIELRPRIEDGALVDNRIKFQLAQSEFISSVDGDVFNMLLNIELRGGGVLAMRAGSAVLESLQVPKGNDCLENGCATGVAVIGPPSSINLFVENLEVSIPEDVSSITVEFEIFSGESAGGEPSYAETVKVVKIDDDIKLASNNVPYAIIFGASGVGLTLLACLVFAVVKTYRGGRTGARGLKHLGHLAVDKMHNMERGGHVEDDPDHVKKHAAHHKKKKNAKPSADSTNRKLSKEAYAVDDSIFDWEKHIDRRTGDVYFFNPKTGESRWDPPEVAVKD